MTDEAKALVEQWRSAIDALPEPWGAFKLSAVKILDLVETQAREIERLREALKGSIGALEFSRDYHSDLSNAEQAFVQDRLDAARAALEGKQ